MSLVLIGIGIYLILLAVKHIYAKNWDKGLYAELALSQTAVYPGSEIVLTETIINRSWLPLPLINVKFAIDKELQFAGNTDNMAVSDKSYKCDVFSLLFYQKITRKLPFTCTKRGYYQIEELDVVSTDLFMENVISVTMPVKKHLLVYPEPLASENVEIPYRRILGSILSKRYTQEDPFEFRGIREYQSFDTMKSINWKASAKTGRLKVNTFENTSAQEVCILLNVEDEGIWVYEDLKEKSISLACSLSCRLIEQGIVVSLLSNGADKVHGEVLFVESGCDDSHRASIVEGLSRIDLKKEAANFEELLEKEASRMAKGSMLVLISTSRRSALQKSFVALQEEFADSLWILPLLPGMSGDLEGFDERKVVRLEF